MSEPEPQVPIFELLPAFEEETGARARPRPVPRAALDEHTPQGAQLQLLAARLRALARDKRLRRIGVVGCSAGAGSTTVALGLARALAAERPLRVLFLELDLKRRSIDRELSLPPPALGVAQFLAGKGELPVLRHPAAGFWVLSGGEGQAPARDRPTSERLARLLSAADRVFDFVIGDCPPLLPDAEAVFLQDHLDGFVLVVRSRHATRESVRRAARMLRPGLVVGLVLNAQRDILPR